MRSEEGLQQLGACTTQTCKGIAKEFVAENQARPFFYSMMHTVLRFTRIHRLRVNMEEEDHLDFCLKFIDRSGDAALRHDVAVRDLSLDYAQMRTLSARATYTNQAVNLAINSGQVSHLVHVGAKRALLSEF